MAQPYSIEWSSWTYARKDAPLTVQPRLLLQAQAATYALAGAAVDSSRRSEGTLRRARLGFDSSLGRFRASFIYDFAHSGGERRGRINAAWIQFTARNDLHLRIGAFAPWQGFEGSSAETQFMERSAPSNLYRSLVGGDARLGGALIADHRRWTLTAAVTGDSINRTEATGQIGAGVRATYLLIDRSATRVHLGASTSLILRAPVLSGARGVRLVGSPEAHIDVPALLDTKALGAQGFASADVELGVQHGALLAQSEYFRAAPRGCDQTCSKAHVAGWYIQGAWTLTGEARRYRSGAFVSPDPLRPLQRGVRALGAWELGVRYSHLVLPSRVVDASSRDAASQDMLSLQINWYLTSAARLSAAVQRGQSERFDGFADDRFRIREYLLRAQYAL